MFVNHRFYSKKISVFIVVLSLVFPSFSHPLKADFRQAKTEKAQKNATLNLTISEFNNKTIVFDLIVDPGNENINLISSIINFSHKKLVVEKIETDDSFLFFIENEFDNNLGNIKITCMQPYPGINEKTQIAKITFKIEESGWADVKINENSLVLASDGYGTNVLDSFNISNIYLN